MGAGSELGFDRIESERLVLRRFEEADLAPFLAYRNDPRVAMYQAWDSYDEREALDFIREMRSAEPGSPGEWFQFAVELKGTGQLVGDCGLKTEEDGRQAEFGVTFAREHQGKGYAYEAVSRLLDYAFGDLGVHRVVAIADRQNAPSVALLERLGMRREGSFDRNVWFKGHWASEYLYAILRDEWLRRHERGGMVERNLRIVSEPHGSPADATFVRESLALFNVAVTGDSYYSPLAIFLKDGRDAVLGGVLGHVWGGWLDLEFLWVSEPFRGQGYGAKLLEAAEEEARSQGCHGVFLTTFSFQAKPFYEKCGYEVVADIPDYPRGHTYHVLKKSLT
jgi:RimJ/RimL family protein N-acetyltransferase